MMDSQAIKSRYDAALAGLSANCKRVAGWNQPVLFEGGCYQGIWLECAPHDSLVYAKHAPEVALATHDAFFHFQREDGYLPFNIGANGPGSITIQMVVPIAEDHRYLMTQWVKAILGCPYFMQQLDPWTGLFTDSKTRDYSPTMLVFIDFVDRLGVLAKGR